MALPPELELASAESLYFEAEAIMHDGPARILLGQYNGRTSPVPSPSSMTYLHVRLSDGQKWTYQPQADHDIAWLATNAGQLEIGNTLLERELAIFAEGHGAISITAHEEAEFVIGSAVKHLTLSSGRLPLSIQTRLRWQKENELSPLFATARHSVRLHRADNSSIFKEIS